MASLALQGRKCSSSPVLLLFQKGLPQLPFLQILRILRNVLSARDPVFEVTKVALDAIVAGIHSLVGEHTGLAVTVPVDEGAQTGYILVVIYLVPLLHGLEHLDNVYVRAVGNAHPEHVENPRTQVLKSDGDFLRVGWQLHVGDVLLEYFLGVVTQAHENVLREYGFDNLDEVGIRIVGGRLHCKLPGCVDLRRVRPRKVVSVVGVHGLDGAETREGRPGAVYHGGVLIVGIPLAREAALYGGELVERGEVGVGRELVPREGSGYDVRTEVHRRPVSVVPHFAISARLFNTL
ncbi:hemolysin secretion protein D [Babesia caballi]|uniref:Hemolysin secretion protein D n=1 Tax=Babesia caballi TaxID=5871 RepID=A0AAV4M3E9_BABCB|nr:hemolysin secretion protein D [Babesia caballi]